MPKGAVMSVNRDAHYITRMLKRGIMGGVPSAGVSILYFDRFSQPLDEIVRARVWAGLHYRTADLQARLLGRNVVRYMAEHYFQPVH